MSKKLVRRGLIPASMLRGRLASGSVLSMMPLSMMLLSQVCSMPKKRVSTFLAMEQERTDWSLLVNTQLPEL